MIRHPRLLLATVLAGSIGLAGIGISRAQSAASTADTAVDTAATTSTTTTATPVRMGHRFGLEDAATKFGMTAAELKTQLDAGKEMYQIAAEHGVTFAEEQAARLTDLKTRLDDMVKVKYMTQAEADSVYAAAKANPMVGFGHGGPRMK